MIDNYGKLLFSTFVVVLLGVVLIVPIGNDVEKAKISSYTVTNETLAFSQSTTTVSNESQVTGSDSIGFTITLTNNDLTVFTELRNVTADIVMGLCNVTLAEGSLDCNGTNSSNLYSDYTYISGWTETLANDELISVSALRNVTSESIIGACNVTLPTGGLVCNNTHNATGYADYAYEPDTYVRSAAARTLLTLTVLLFALFILGVGVAYVLKSFKEGKLI